MSEAAHSPLGASAAERWMNCPGSVALVKQFMTGVEDDTEEPAYRAEGTAAHEFAARCLRDGTDAWELVGEKAENGVEMSVPMSEAVQVYLDDCRTLVNRAAADGYKGPVITLIEQRVAIEAIDGYYGTLDYAVIAGPFIYLRDFKYGAGVLVEPEKNVQFLYYANALLEGHPDIARVEVGVVQPRMPHPYGPVRRWKVAAPDVRAWAVGELYPAMQRARRDMLLVPGEWCRFCPVKLQCPALQGLFKAACQTRIDRAEDVSNQMLSLNYASLPAVKKYIAALEAEVFARVVTRGIEIPGVKAVRKKANRVWKPGAAEVLESRLPGMELYEAPSLKSPARIDELGPMAKEATAEWAYTPDTGYTVALASDPRPAVKIEPPSKTFEDALTNVAASA